MSFLGSYHEKWYTALDEALSNYFDNCATTDNTKISNNNNALIQALIPVSARTYGGYIGPQTIDEFSFLRDYGRRLDEAGELTYLYNGDWVDDDADADREFPDETNVKRFKEIVEIYCDVLARLERQLKAPLKPVVPLLKRKRDLVYFIYFLIHIPVIICECLSGNLLLSLAALKLPASLDTRVVLVLVLMRASLLNNTCPPLHVRGLTPSSRRRSSPPRASPTPND